MATNPILSKYGATPPSAPDDAPAGELTGMDPSDMTLTGMNNGNTPSPNGADSPDPIVRTPIVLSPRAITATNAQDIPKAPAQKAKTFAKRAGKSNTRTAFEKEFAANRKAGNGTFTFKGKLYNTKLKGMAEGGQVRKGWGVARQPGASRGK